MARRRSRALRVAIRFLLLIVLAVVAYDATLHGLAFFMGHDEYMAAAGLVISSEMVPPSGAVPEVLRPLIFPAFSTWAAYDLFWFAVHAGAAAALGAVTWLSFRLSPRRSD